MDPVALALVNLYPNPQTPGLGANYIFLSPQTEDWTKWDVRIDANLSTRNNVFWRFSKQKTYTPATLNLPAPAYGGAALDSNTDGINTGATWNHIFSSNLVLSLRGAWNYGFFTRDIRRRPAANC